MAIDTPSEAVGRTAAAAGYDDRQGSGEGWVQFSGVMLLVLGTINLIGGIAAIDNANFYVANAHYVISDLSTWGWVVLVTGVVQLLAGLGIFARNQFARWLGVAFASLNMIAQFLFFPAQPLWSLALIAIDTMVVFGLIAYGGRERDL